MTWFAAGAAAISAVGTVASSASAARSGQRTANAVSLAEGKAITKERLNQTIRNSYSTALGQMQLGMQKRQLTQQGADISAARLMAKGDADANTAASGSVGASVDAVSADIDMKAQTALDMTEEQYENSVENYNRDLQMMVLNTNESTPNVNPNTYNGPSMGSIVGGAILGAGAQFAGQYASRKMSLGLGPRAGGGTGGGISLSSPAGLGLRYGTQRSKF